MGRAMKDSGVEYIGQLPASWELEKIKFLASYNTEALGEDTPENYIFDYIDIGSVENGKGITAMQRMSFSAAPSRARRIVKKNDVIVSTVRTYLKAVASIDDFDTPQIVSTGFVVLRAKEDSSITAEFLKYSVLSESFISEVASQSVGISYPAINSSDVVEIKIPVPPISEQQIITIFLDEQCTKIDSIIEKTQESIEEYKRLKQAVITQAVTKGVRGDRLMKDSGIEWVGDVPADWNVQRIKTIFSMRDEKNYLPLEEVNLISLYTDLGVVQHADLENTTGNKASNADGYKKVYENDIVVNIILCWMGAIGRSTYNGVTSPAYDIYVPSEEIDCRFYHYYFRTSGFSGDCYKNGRGIMAMRWRTYSDEFRNIRVVVPSKEEQTEIAVYLDEKCAEIDALIAQKEQLLAELENYKKSLIYEYVTGKKEVPHEC